MTVKSLGNPYDGDNDLIHGAACSCADCAAGHTAHKKVASDSLPQSSEEMLERVVENAVVRSVFGQNEFSRRSFAKMLGGGAMAGLIGSFFPMDKAKAAILDNLGTPEKKNLQIGFVPITCATPIIMAQPLGFYEKYGLNTSVIKTAGWAVARDKSLNGDAVPDAGR
jgi:nitrate/nitrite transport system substrate-binding protein